VPEPYRVASFSSLAVARDGRETGLEMTAAVLDAEAPDHDARAIAPAPGEDAAPDRTIFAFPRGVRAGTCVHEIFEELDFAAVAPPGLVPTPLEAIAAIAPVVERKLAEHRFEPEWRATMVETVRRAVTLPLDAAGHVRLAGVDAARCARELEFYYPVDGLDVSDLRSVLLDHRLAGGRFDDDVASLGFARVEGFMKGFIDLVFEANGRFFVLDYKSNHLGDRADDYAPERLAAAMGRDGYYLQYLIYTLTLHRMLALRLPDYDPARHLGGAFYVFVRGLDPSRPPGWSVFHDRPSPALVRALDRLVAGEVPRKRARPGGRRDGGVEAKS
jgi:exodeoxyribonuclease V beta subunit